MTTARSDEERLPRPLSDGDSHPFWEGVTRGELWIQRCTACGRHVFYPRSLCPHCHATALTWVQASGEGTIYSYTVARQAFGPFFGQTPFVVAIVELAESVRLLTRILDAAPDAVRIGAPVHVTFEQVEQGGEGEAPLILPYFRLIEATV